MTAARRLLRTDHERNPGHPRRKPRQEVSRVPRLPGPLRRPFDRRTATALDGLDLRVEPGRVFCLLGPNGAGKTTLIKILATLVLPDGGRAAVDGHDVARDPARAKGAVGYAVGDERSFYWRLTGRENLEFFAALYGLRGPARSRRIADLLDLVGLEAAADLRFNAYSTGMRQMLAFARALLADASHPPRRRADPVARSAGRGQDPVVPPRRARRRQGQDRLLGHPRPRRGRRLRRRHRRHQPGQHPPLGSGRVPRRRRAGGSPPDLRAGGRRIGGQADERVRGAGQGVRRGRLPGVPPPRPPGGPDLQVLFRLFPHGDPPVVGDLLFRRQARPAGAAVPRALRRRLLLLRRRRGRLRGPPRHVPGRPRGRRPERPALRDARSPARHPGPGPDHPFRLVPLFARSSRSSGRPSTSAWPWPSSA